MIPTNRFTYYSKNQAYLETIIKNNPHRYYAIIKKDPCFLCGEEMNKIIYFNPMVAETQNKIDQCYSIRNALDTISEISHLKCIQTEQLLPTGKLDGLL